MKEERLYIIGYMACGKSTFGKALAHATGRKFIDLDHEIERTEGRSVAEIISSEGEARFREIETRILKSTAAVRHAVIACGGGTPCYRDNMEFMTLHGLTLWLIASPERIAKRILEAGNLRPLVAGKNREELLHFIHAHLLRRQPYYIKASWRFSGEHLESEKEIADSVDSFLRQFPIS